MPYLHFEAGENKGKEVEIKLGEGVGSPLTDKQSKRKNIDHGFHKVTHLQGITYLNSCLGHV